MTTPRPLFKSFFQGGFECSSHKRANGQRLDLLGSTKHDVFARTDYLRCQRLGIRTVRDGIRWHLIERRPGHYDFSSFYAMLRAAQATRTQVIWDVFHFGWPDHLDVWTPRFVDAYARLAREFAKVLQSETDEPQFLAPSNEISFLSWAGADVAAVNPYTKGRGHELKRQLVRAAIAAAEAIWDVLPDARLVYPEPVIHIIPYPDRPQDAEDARRYSMSQYQSWDMIAGRAMPELGGRAKYLDVIGVNFYDRNEWYHKDPSIGGDGDPVKRDSPLWKPFQDILMDVWARYRRPMFISETGTENEERPSWFRYIAEQVLGAVRRGVAVHGICLYPIVNHPGWVDDRHCCNGLFDYATDRGEREICRPLEDELKKQTEKLSNLFTDKAPSRSDIELIVLSHLRWQFVFQRPQHLMSRFARERRVFFIEEPIFGAEQAHMECRTCPQTGVHICVPHLPHGLASDHVIQLQEKLIEKLIRDERIGDYFLWYYTPMALPFSRGLDAKVTVYDCMDELSMFKGAPPELKEWESRLFNRSDLVFTGGVSLYEVKRTQHNRAYPFPSGVELEHFRQARAEQPEPEDQKSIPHPRLGFCGVIDERMDIDLVRGLAEKRPDWHIVMIGPVVKIDPATLPQEPNIHYLGAKSYGELPAYFAKWDVGILPFAKNDSTRFISPTKTPEYLAAGLPVVSTSIRDVVRPYQDLGLAHIADTPDEFVAAVERAFKDPENSEWRSKADEFLLTKSWDSTWAAMNTLIHQVMDEKAAVSESITSTEGAEQACSIS